jgi:NADH dehydrogenase
VASELNAVTGAFGYTGNYIARRLLARGTRVLTLTGHPERPNSFGAQVAVEPFRFDNPMALAECLGGVAVLYNTYWVRFSHGAVTFERAVENTLALLRAAEAAGVRRIVHISVTNASENSPLGYFRGKGQIEAAIRSLGLSYAILRPTVIFGPEDILINNIAWMLRRFPMFPIPGAGDYRLQPVFVEDVADLAVAAGEREENESFDAVGPDVYTFDELVEEIREAVGSRARTLHFPPGLALLLSRLLGVVMRDVILTADEVRGLMANLLVSDAPPTGRTRLIDWLRENAARVGAQYASELARHYGASTT